jgi:predicted transglutaminase-like cysteine proteinase
MTDEEMIEMLRNSVGVSEAACSAARKAADRIEQLVAINEQLNEKIKKLDKLVYNSYCDGFVEAWDCPCISSGYTFTWESSETYKTLK